MKNLTLSAPAAADLRKMYDQLRAAAHPTLTFSQLVELLVWHWNTVPADPSAMMNFDFKTKLGRPRSSS